MTYFTLIPPGWLPLLISGAWMTILVALSGFAIGAILGALGAWAKISGRRWVRGLADGYTTVLRGIPDLLVIYLFYFGSSVIVTSVFSLFGGHGFVSVPGFLAGSLAIGLCCGAQHAEFFRGAYLAIAPGELEAAVASGMTRAVRFHRIVLPLTLRHAIPGLGNVWQVVLKESALVSVTGLAELLRQTQVGAGSTGLPFNFYLTAAVIYLTISSFSSISLAAAERYYSRGAVT